MPAEYSIAIYKPGSTENVWKSFSSSSPFVGIVPGVLIHPAFWEGSEAPLKVLRVPNVEHAIWEDPKAGGTLKQKMLVYTEEVDYSNELLIAKRHGKITPLRETRSKKGRGR